VASMVAVEQPPAALVLLSYPLHAPGRQSSWEDRTAHWPAIRCPVLLLSGESDPFAEIGLLRTAVGRLADASLVTYPGVGHGVGPVLDDALDRVAAFAKEHT
jgi:predicted alpha/beta-hydrolase family hydrolase